MKFIFSAMILLATIINSLQARDMIVITYHTKSQRAQLIQKILETEVGIPTKLISLHRQTAPCQKRSLPIVQLCVDENEQMHFVVFNEQIVLNSFNVFMEN